MPVAIKFLPTFFDDDAELTLHERTEFLTAFSTFAGVIGAWTTGRFSPADFLQGLYVHDIPQARRVVKQDVWAFAWPESLGRSSKYRCTFHLVDPDPVTGYPVRLEIRRVGTHAIYDAP